MAIVGSKGDAGVAQPIISLISPHVLYIEAFAGLAAVGRLKRAPPLLRCIRGARHRPRIVINDDAARVRPGGHWRRNAGDRRSESRLTRLSIAIRRISCPRVAACGNITGASCSPMRSTGGFWNGRVGFRVGS